MEIIPVVDLRRAKAVHARAGQRAQYQPLVSRLSPTPDPADVVAGLLRLSDFHTLYLADLDAIQGETLQRELIGRLQVLFPRLEFWVDAGWPLPEGCGWTPVVGSESLDTKGWREVQALRGRWILSLDHLDGRFRGAPEILEQPQRWPELVIHMNLNRVGTGAGPDLGGLRQLQERIGSKRIVAAGGVRGWSDLLSLETMGIGKVLVASSLHDGSLMPGS